MTSQGIHPVIIIMVVQKFVFRENWVGSKMVTSMKTTFLPFLTQFGPTLWPQKTQIKNSLNRMLVFNQQERQKLYYHQFCDFRIY